MATQASEYAAFFRRPADFVREPRPGATPAVSVARFPPRSAGFVRRIITPVHNRWVYITRGMSSLPMRIPPKEAALYPARIELIAYCEGAFVGAHDGQDMVSAYLQALAAMPFETEMFLGPMHTAALPEAISP